MLAGVNKSLEKELQSVWTSPARHSRKVQELSSELEKVYNERDDLSRKYNLLVVAWALEVGKRHQCQREMEEYRRVFNSSVQCMVKTGLPFTTGRV